MNMSPSSIPLLLRPVFIRQILCFAITKKSRKGNALLSLLKFGQVCSEWKNTILYYSIGSCLTVALPKHRINFQEAFLFVCECHNAWFRGKEKAKLLERFGIIGEKKKQRHTLEFDHNEILLHVLRLMIREWKLNRNEILKSSIMKRISSTGRKSALRIAVDEKNPILVRFLLFEAFNEDDNENNNNNDDNNNSTSIKPPMTTVALNLNVELTNLAGTRAQKHRHDDQTGDNLIAQAAKSCDNEEVWTLLIEACNIYAKQIYEKVKSRKLLLKKDSYKRMWIRAYQSGTSLFDLNGLMYFCVNSQPFSGAFLTNERNDYESPLCAACAVGNAVAVKCLLKYAKCDPNLNWIENIRQVSMYSNVPGYACFRRNFENRTIFHYYLTTQLEQPQNLECFKLLCQFGLTLDASSLEAHQVISTGLVYWIFSRFSMGSHRNGVMMGDRAFAPVSLMTVDKDRLVHTTKFLKILFGFDDGNAVENSSSTSFAASRTILAAKETERVCRYVPLLTMGSVSTEIVLIFIRAIQKHPTRSKELFERVKEDLSDRKKYSICNYTADTLEVFFDHDLMTAESLANSAQIAEKTHSNQPNALITLFSGTRQHFESISSCSGTYLEQFLLMEIRRLKLLVERGKLKIEESFASAEDDPTKNYPEGEGNTILHEICARRLVHGHQLRLLKYVVLEYFPTSTIEEREKRLKFLNHRNKFGRTAVELAWIQYHKVRSSGRFTVDDEQCFRKIKVDLEAQILNFLLFDCRGDFDPRSNNFPQLEKYAAYFASS